MLHKIMGKTLYNLPATFHLTKGAAVCYNGISAPAQVLAPRTNNSRLKIIGYHLDNIWGH